MGDSRASAEGTEFVMPSLGADMSAGTIARWCVSVGDTVERGDIIAEVETDKGLIEVEVFASGRVTALLVDEGTKVPVGTPLATIEAATPETAKKTRAKKTPAKKTPAKKTPAKKTPAKTPAKKAAEPEPVRRKRPRSHTPPSTPSARRAAREAHVSMAGLTGSGGHGRIVLEDVRHRGSADTGGRLRITPVALRRAKMLGLDPRSLSGTGRSGAILLADVESGALAKLRRVKKPRPPGMRAAVGAAMSRSKREIPHYYLTHTIDLGAAMAWLEEHNRERSPAERLLPAVLLIKAVSRALRIVPELNALWNGDKGVAQHDVNVGIAVSIRGGGLVAPAIERADLLSLGELMSVMSDLVTRARRGKLRASEMTHSNITITSLGHRGVDVVVPVIVPPQVAIVGFGTIAERPWVVDGEVVARPVVTASLAADHRVSDGHRGARFLAAVANFLQTPEKL